MTLQPLDVKSLLNRHHLRPNKKLGQNFLIDEAVLEKVIEAGDLKPEDFVLEIGAGLGSLTRLLAMRARRVLAVEMDRNLIPVLGEVLGKFDNVSIIQGDILEINLSELLGEVTESQPFLVVANIPYYITSALVRLLLETQKKPTRLVLTVQAEVAERITAEPGKMSLLALSVQVYGQAEIVTHVPAQSFYPSPKIDSAIMRVNLYPAPLLPEESLDVFFHLAKAGFSQKRKTLRNALSGGLAISTQEAGSRLEQAGIDPQRRAETLSISEWGELARIYSQSYPQ